MEIEPDAFKAYDYRRHRRYVAYWAMCCIVDGATEPYRDDQLRITADWHDHAALVAKYSPKRARKSTAGFTHGDDDGEGDDPAALPDPQPTRWRGMAGTSVIMDM